jgi:hypothetical protein
MKGCHSCPHGQAIAAGEYEGKRWEDVPCSTCDVMSGTGFALEFDEERGSVGSEQSAAGSTHEDLEDRLPVSVMRELVVGLLKLKPELRDVVAWRFAGVRYADIALAQGVTQACAEKRHRRAMELWPALRSLFPRKVAKQGMRKPARRRERQQ